MDPELHAFARLLHPLSRVLVVGSILTELEVRAVPAAFVVDGEGYVVSVGAYGGTPSARAGSYDCSPESSGSTGPPVPPSP
jgi:hypothetical protein